MTVVWSRVVFKMTVMVLRKLLVIFVVKRTISTYVTVEVMTVDVIGTSLIKALQRLVASGSF